MVGTQIPTVAFLGLGAMGFAMSTYLLKQGVPIVGFDVWKPTLDKFEAASRTIPNAAASTTTSPAEAARSAQIVLLMVANHHHVDSALFDPEVGAIKTIPQNATIIICSTIPPTHPPLVRQRLDTEFLRPDINLIDAPVSGGTVGSATGTLTIMSSSNDSSALTNPLVNLILSHLSAHGARLYTIPGGLGAGTSAKALNQVMCGTHIVGASEIMALAALNGLDTQKFYETMTSPDPGVKHNDNSQPGTFDPVNRRYGWTWMFEARGPRMLDLSLPVASATAIIAKDVGIIKDEETRLGIELEQLNKVHALLAQCMAAGMTTLDDALINQWYLGLDTPRKELATTLARSGASTLNTPEQDRWTATLLLAHTCINFMSAWETVRFAEALDLMGPEQRRMWFEIIAGAAGGSRVFSEVVPLALAGTSDWREGFVQYAKQVFGEKDLASVDAVIAASKSMGLEPVLVETALAFTRGLMRDQA